MNLKFTPPDEDWALFNAYARFHLSNGQIVYDDQDASEQPFWFRLQDYIYENSLRIVLIVLKFRSNEIHFPIAPDESFIYFSYGAGRDSGNDLTDNFYVLGREDRELHGLKCEWYKTPELTKFQTVHKGIQSEIKNRRVCVLPPS